MKGYLKFGIIGLLLVFGACRFVEGVFISKAQNGVISTQISQQKVEAKPLAVQEPVVADVNAVNNGCKQVIFDGRTYENGSYMIDGKIYISADVIADAYGFKSVYNTTEDAVMVTKSDSAMDDYIRYTIKNGEYYFYSSELAFVTLDTEFVSIAELEQKGISVFVNSRNTRSSNWTPSYVTDFVFTYNGLTYEAKGKPYVQLTIDENYVITRPDVDISNLTWRIIENGEVVLERNAQNEYSYQYYANKSGCNYQVCLIAYFEGYEVISNVIEYTVE